MRRASSFVSSFSGIVDLFRQEVRPPLKSYGGVVMWGVAQLWRLELLILMRAR
jgi:hypothetical protein